MSMKKIKISGLDKKFSDWVRHRDNWTCKRCKHIHNKYSARSKMGLHCSHFFGLCVQLATGYGVLMITRLTEILKSSNWVRKNS